MNTGKSGLHKAYRSGVGLSLLLLPELWKLVGTYSVRDCVDLVTWSMVLLFMDAPTWLSCPWQQLMQ